MFRINLKKLRENKHISQATLARALGVRQSTVAMWESGKNYPEFKTLEKIATYFDVSTDYLIGRTSTAHSINLSVDYLLGRDEDTKKEPAANSGGELSGIDAELYELLMGLPDDKLQDAMRYVRYLKSLPDNE